LAQHGRDEGTGNEVGTQGRGVSAIGLVDHAVVVVVSIEGSLLVEAREQGVIGERLGTGLVN